MLATVHALTGFAIGASLNNVPISFAVGFASHFILDAIPHYDTPVKSTKPNIISPVQIWVILFDQLIMLGMTFFIVPYLWPALLSSLIGALGAIAPDIISSMRLFFPELNIGLYRRFNQWHFDIQPRDTAPLIGSLTQLVVVIISVLYIIL